MSGPHPLAPQDNFLLLIDASSYIHRAYHALPKTLRRRDHLNTGALAGFCNTMLKILRLNWTPIGRRPSHVAMVLDVRGKNFRHDLYPLYKANRAGYEPELEEQLPWLPPIAKAFNVESIGLQGYEADDIIATYCRLAKEDGLDVVIASSDKDLYQLIEIESDRKTVMYDAMKDKGRDDNVASLIGPHQVYEKFGVWPSQMVDLQAIVGDKVDNIPGVPSLGPKSAATLLAQFGDVISMLDEADWGDDAFKNKKWHGKIVEHRDDILISRQLVELDQRVPLELEVDDLFVKSARERDLEALFNDLEFAHLIRKIYL